MIPSFTWNSIAANAELERRSKCIINVACRLILKPAVLSHRESIVNGAVERNSYFSIQQYKECATSTDAAHLKMANLFD